MSHLLNIISSYKNLIVEANAYNESTHKKSFQFLFFLASFFLVTAAIGNLFSGYHFAFIEVNSLGVYIPDFILEMITVFGDGFFLLALVLFFTTKNVRFHWTVLFSSLLGLIFINYLKNYFHMPRPPAVLDVGTFHLIGKAYTSRSFPSGHSFTAFLVATLCFCYIKNIGLKALFIFLAVMVALSRVMIGVHWPSDVLVGGALGIFIGITGVWVTDTWKVGLCPAVHLFAVSLFVVSCVVILVDGNDYKLALPMMYLVSIAALARLLSCYCFLNKS